MSQVAPLSEGHSVSSLAVVVLLLVPCVVLLLLLNCLFLGCKLLALAKRRSRSRRGAAQEMLLRASVSDVSFSPLPGRRGDVATPPKRVVTHPVTSSRASSREAQGAGHGMRLLSTIRATASSSSRVASGRDPLSALRTSAPLLTRFSDSEVRVNLVPPNSPTAPPVPKAWSAERFGAAGELQGGSSRNLEGEELFHHQSYNLPDVSPDTAGLQLDFLDWTSCCSSAVGPGLDGDFGASAGVSLRILSVDSDGGPAPSLLEWDYYDPSYVRQNNVPKPQHHHVALHSKHYWV